MTRAGRTAGVTLVELLVVVAVIGLMVGLLLPAVQAARESARASDCQSRLRQIALAVTLHSDATRSLPSARSDGVVGSETAEPVGGPTWLWTILPYVEHGMGFQWPAGEKFRDVPEAVQKHVVGIYLCPSRRSTATALTEASAGPPRVAACGCLLPGLTVESGAISDYAGNQGDLSSGPADFYRGGRGTGTIIGSRVEPESKRPVDRLKWRDISDGLSATLLLGEAHARQAHAAQLPDVGPAYDGSQFQFCSRVGGPGVGIAAGPLDDGAGTGWMAFGSWHPAGCQVAFADGRVGRLTANLAPDILATLCNRGDGSARAATE
jgi:prepilin-type processing-associated H-X9-DG protein